MNPDPDNYDDFDLAGAYRDAFARIMASAGLTSGSDMSDGLTWRSDTPKNPPIAIDHSRLLARKDELSTSSSESDTPMSDTSDTSDTAAFWHCRDVLASIFANACARGRSPYALLAHALGRALYTVPYTVPLRTYIGDAPLNFISVSIGGSAAGKSVAPDILDATLHFEAIPTWPVTYEAGSGEAIPDVYAGLNEIGALDWKRHEACWGFDESGKLSKVSGRDGSTVLEYLKTAWSGGHLGRVLANGKEKMLPKGSYRFTCHINAQPGRAGFMLSPDAVAGGLPQRFVWFNAEARGPKLPRGTVSHHTVPAIKWSGISSIRATVEMEDYFEAANDNPEAIDGHEALARAKVAVALAVLDGRPVLNAEDWELAGLVMAHSAQTRAWTMEQADAGDVANSRHDGRLYGHRLDASSEVQHRARLDRVANRLMSIYTTTAGSANRRVVSRALGRDSAHLDECLNQMLHPTDGQLPEPPVAAWLLMLLSTSKKNKKK